MSKQIFVKKEAIGGYGKAPEDRTSEELVTYGIINLDKPKGPTSHQVSDYVQNILGISKAGHSGTLDPQVTGVQPIALGRATRITEFLLTAPKEYICLMHLHKEVSEELLKEAVVKLSGKIQQLPPIKSAVKREVRTREIYEIAILEIEGQEVLFRIGVQAGTYIRKYCHDFGLKLGCGAHMEELRRTKVATFDESTLVTLQDLTDAFHYYKNENNDKFIRKIIQPFENAVRHLPKVWVLDTTINPLSHGRDLAVLGISKIESGIKEGDITAIMTLKGELIGLGIAQMSSEDVMKKDNGIAIRTNSVFIQT